MDAAAVAGKEPVVVKDVNVADEVVVVVVKVDNVDMDADDECMDDVFSG